MTGEPDGGLRSAPLGDDDLDEVLELNEHWVPHVGTLTREALAVLVERSEMAQALWQGEGDDRLLAGFVVVMGPGADYASPNYRYFSDRHDRFTYVDRIAVSPGTQGAGVGRGLYESVFEHARSAGSPVVCAEVNVEPPNPESLAFHERMGFEGVGTQWTYGDTVRVKMLERRV